MRREKHVLVEDTGGSRDKRVPVQVFDETAVERESVKLKQDHTYYSGAHASVWLRGVGWLKNVRQMNELDQSMNHDSQTARCPNPRCTRYTSTHN